MTDQAGGACEKRNAFQCAEGKSYIQHHGRNGAVHIDGQGAADDRWNDICYGFKRADMGAGGAFFTRHGKKAVGARVAIRMQRMAKTRNRFFILAQAFYGALSGGVDIVAIGDNIRQKTAGDFSAAEHYGTASEQS